tara:strand:- start:622 stop:924 length:303 start_codon:yes stop_codon:yes gene_type:complete
MAKREMMNQMSDQMDIPKRKARNLMKKANTMNDMEMAMGGLNKGQRALRKKNPEAVAKMEGVSVDKVMGMADGGMARVQGTPPAQVKGFTYNDNSGKGTF